jgi:ribosomal protein L21E
MAPLSKKKATKKVAKVMKEYKAGTLHSGKGGPVVKSRKQAVAIAMSEAKMSKKKGKK